MCTVVVLARERGGYVLGHNRDEALGRPRAHLPRVVERGGRAIIAPLDPQGGGTWVAVNAFGVSICILNAAHVAPDSLPEAPESRGKVALALSDAGTADDAFERLDALGDDLPLYRAFHVVAVEPGEHAGAPRIALASWDGRRLSSDRRKAPALFVSALLDQRGAERARGASFRRLLDAGAKRGESGLREWLASHEPEAGMLSVCVHRDDALTVSRTIVRVSQTAIDVDYTDGQPCSIDATDHHVSIDRSPLRPVPDAQSR